MFSTDTSFSLYLLANHGSYFTVDTAANIQPLHAVFIIFLYLILTVTACIDTDTKVSLLFSYFTILATIFSPCAIDLSYPRKARSCHGRERGWRGWFEKFLRVWEGWGHHNSERIFDESCRGEEGWGHQNLEHFLMKPVEERKDKDTMEQIFFLNKSTYVQADYRYREY